MYCTDVTNSVNLKVCTMQLIYSIKHDAVRFVVKHVVLRSQFVLENGGLHIESLWCYFPSSVRMVHSIILYHSISAKACAVPFPNYCILHVFHMRNNFFCLSKYRPLFSSYCRYTLLSFSVICQYVFEGF